MAKQKGSSNQQRGRQAQHPGQIPKVGWLDILWRVKDEIARDNVSIVAAGIAFYGLLAFVPAIVALMSTWALVFDPDQAMQQINSFSQMLPPEAADIIKQQAQQASSNAGTGMSLAAIGGILLAIYSTSKGINALMEGLNIIYDEKETRGLVRKTLVKLVLTFGAILMTLVTLATVVAIPAATHLLGLNDTVSLVVNLARWPILLVVLMVALAVLYRYAPDRDKPRWQWISVGSIASILLWIIGSIGFSIYVRNFGSYNETYGALGAVVILLMWFWLSGFIILLGAELNSEMERQTEHDTTSGTERPMGERGAHAADTVGEKRK